MNTLKFADSVVAQAATIVADSTIAEAAIKVATAAIISHAEAMVKEAADKDKTKEKTEFNETSPNVQNPTSSHPIDNAQGELAPQDTAYIDQTQAPLVPPNGQGPVVGDGDINNATQMPPQVAGPNAAAGLASPAPADSRAPSQYDLGVPEGDAAVMQEQGMPPAMSSTPDVAMMSQTAAQVARDFLGNEVYNAASNGHAQAMDLMARTAAQLGVGVAEALARAIPGTYNQMPEDVSAMGNTQGLDPNAAAAMGEGPGLPGETYSNPAQASQMPDQNAPAPSETGDGNIVTSPTAAAPAQSPTQEAADKVIADPGSPTKQEQSPGEKNKKPGEPK